MRLCKDCVYCVPSKNFNEKLFGFLPLTTLSNLSFEFSKCTRNTKISYTHGGVIEDETPKDYCEESRNNPLMCGPEAKYFVEWEDD